MVDAALDAPAIGFELRFARSACSDATAELRHGFASAGEAREHVFELRELDLELAFASAGVAGEDVEDELRAIEDAARQSGLEIAQLRGRQVVIEENEIGVGGRGDAGDFFNLPGSNERCRIEAVAALQNLSDHRTASAREELAKLCKRLGSVKTGSLTRPVRTF